MKLMNRFNRFSIICRSLSSSTQLIHVDQNRHIPALWDVLLLMTPFCVCSWPRPACWRSARRRTRWRHATESLSTCCWTWWEEFSRFYRFRHQTHYQLLLKAGRPLPVLVNQFKMADTPNWPQQTREWLKLSHMFRCWSVRWCGSSWTPADD